MCLDKCDKPSVILVDVDFGGLTETSVDDAGVEHVTPIPPQRLDFCVAHAAELGLTETINKAKAVEKGTTKGGHPFPNRAHSYADEFDWVVV